MRSLFLAIIFALVPFQLFAAPTNPLGGGQPGPGRCRYECAKTGSPNAAPQQEVTCQQDSDCASDCRARCPIPSTNTQTNGNGLGTGATGYACAQPTQARCILPADTRPADGAIPPIGGTAGSGRCAYRCRDAQGASGAAQTPQVIISCAQTSDCMSDCRARCPIASASGDGSGNGLGPSGSGLTCNETAQVRCVSAPLLSQQAPPPTASQSAAQTSDLPNPLGTTSIVAILGRIVKAFMSLLGAVALAWLVWGGALWMTGGYDKSNITEAKTIMQNAALGLVLILFAYALTNAFLSLFEGGTSSRTTTTSRTTNAR